MIISPETIIYFLTGKQKIDHTLIIKLAKCKGVEVSDSMRKNMGNFLSGKHKPSETTLKNFASLLKDTVSDKYFSDEIDSANLLGEIDLSTPELNLKYIETGYSNFFRSANSEDGFLANEVNNTVKGLYELYTLKEDGASDVEFEEALSRSELLPKIDYSDSLYLKIENKVDAFSLDLLLYYFACIAVDGEERDASIIRVMFDEITNEEFKSPFACYISIIKSDCKIKNRKIKNEEIAEFYKMDMPSFYRYKSGKRALPTKTIALMIERADMLYFMTLFWMNLTTCFSTSVAVDSRLMIIHKIKSYSKLFDIAKAEFCDFKKKKQGMTQN